MGIEVIKNPETMREKIQRARSEKHLIGLVPTMGFFHEGHLELMRRAREDCDVVVVSLFVNPTQFGVGEDFEDYPRDFERDRVLAEKEGVDYLFAPDVSDMYPEGFSTYVEVKGLSEVMCGIARPGHFRGVATVVTKLFNIIPAHKAYFGQKDAQQLAIIRRMVTDLNIPVEIVSVPTVRESDGLAMSSRNIYLDSEERKAATVLYRALKRAAEMIDAGERDASVLKEKMKELVSTEPLVSLEYIEICDNIYLKPLQELSGELLVAIAARVGRARLIDNMLFDLG